MLPQLKPDFELVSPAQHYDYLHTPVHGTAVLWERAGAGHWHKLTPGDSHIPALLAAQAGQSDRYLTVNQFWGWRLVRNIRSLRALYVDVDGSEDLPLALEALRDAQLPAPSIVVFSGRGMHLYWLHDPVPGNALPVWQRCQDALIKALAGVGADPAARDCARVLRLVGSVNSKNAREVRGLVLDPAPYGFRHLCDEVLGYRESRPAKVLDLPTAKAHRGQRTRTGSIYDRWHLVYQDLLKIAEWHFLGGIPHGHRDRWLFLCATALSWFAHPMTLRDELEKQASVWTPGLEAAEVRAALQAPLERACLAAEGKMLPWQGNETDPRYRFRRETLWQWMNDIIPTELAPQLRAIVSADVKVEHEKEREARRDRVAEGRHKTRRADSAERTKPWEALGVSRATYYRQKKAGA